MWDTSTEQELQHSQEWVFNDPCGHIVLEVVREFVPDVQSAYILSHTPDQSEDFYAVIVNGVYIVSMEINRQTQQPTETSGWTVKDFEQLLGRNRLFRRTLATAIALTPGASKKN